MLKSINTFIDFGEFDDLKTMPVRQNNYTILSTANKKFSPSPKYIFKTFNFNCVSSSDQKTIFQTFSQICSRNNQYLHSYKGISFFYKSKYSPTFSMKCISTTTLAYLIQNSKVNSSWTIFEMLKCLFAVAEGLSYLHDHLICHGNLCPSNILIDQANQCYVCDFGLYPIKKLFVSPDKMTNSDYRDPLMGNNEPNFKNDVYSYGVLLCQLCLIFYDETNKTPLHDFIAINNNDKYQKFPRFFSELIISCLSPYADRPSFKQIINHFQTSQDVVGSYYMKDIYHNFTESNYVVNLATLGDHFAFNKLGKMFELGKGIEKNRQKALLSYEKSALKDNSEAKSNYGLLLLENPDKTDEDKLKAAKNLRESAEQGNIHGMANYGVLLKLGDGIQPNIAKSLEFMKKSADLGYAYAQANYGYTLLENNPTNDQIKEGLKYIKKAMDQNNSYAFYVYGFVLKHGVSIDKDVRLSKKYFKIAAEMGYEDAMIECSTSDLDEFHNDNDQIINRKYYQIVSERGVDETKRKANSSPVSVNKSESNSSNQSTSQNVLAESPTNSEAIDLSSPPVVYSISSSSSFDNLFSDPNQTSIDTPLFKDESSSSKKVPDDTSSSISTKMSKSEQESDSQPQKQEAVDLPITTTPKVEPVSTTQTPPHSSQTQTAQISPYASQGQTASTTQTPPHSSQTQTTLTPPQTSQTSPQGANTVNRTRQTQLNFASSAAPLSQYVPAESSISQPLLQNNQIQSQIQYQNGPIYQNISPFYQNYQYYNMQQNLQMLSNSVVTSSMNQPPLSQSYVPVNVYNSLQSYQNTQNMQNMQNLQETQIEKPARRGRKPKKSTKTQEKQKTLDPIYTSVVNHHHPPIQQLQKEPILQTTESITTNETETNLEYDSEKLLSTFTQMKEEFEAELKENNSLIYQYDERSKYPLFQNEDYFIKTNNALIIYKYAKLYSKTGLKEDTAKSMNYFKIAADLGNAKAQNMYGLELQEGKNIDKNLKVGLLYLEKSAKQGNLNGLDNYGLALYNGEGTKKNKELGLKYMKEAADKGLIFAQLHYGMFTDNYEEGHKIIQKLADANLGEAFMPLANDFMEGRGVEQNYRKASEILKNLYDAENDIKVLIKLIECLKPIDYKSALDYIKILSELKEKNHLNDIRYAQLEYGMELVRGEYLPKNIEEGNKYITKSTLVQELRKQYPDIYAQLPHDFSSVKRKVEFFLSRNHVVDPNEETIIASAYSGDPDDTFKAGKMIEESGDIRTALFFYEIAADTNQKDAAFTLADYYLDGSNRNKINKTKFDKIIKKAAELGSPSARYEILKPKLKQNKKIKYDKLEAFMQDITEMAQEKFIPAIILKAKYFINKENMDEAEKELDTALSLSQNNTKFQYKIGKLMILIPDKVDKGYEILKSCCEREPKASYLLGKLYYDKIYKTQEDLIMAEKYLIRASDGKIKDSRRLLTSVRKDLAVFKQKAQVPKPVENSLPSSAVMHEQKEKQMQVQQPSIDMNDDENYIDADLPTAELIQKGDEFFSKKIFTDAFQCYEICATRGEPLAYYKCAQICQDFNRKLDYYQNAIINNIEGAFSEWRKCIVDYVSKHHSTELHRKYAQRFEEYKDYSDAAILYRRLKEDEKFEECYKLAKENMDDIKDGEQQLDFGKLLEINNETELAITMFRKAYDDNGIHQAERKIKEISKNSIKQLQNLDRVDSLVEQGICYFEGRNGTTVDINKAMTFFKEASGMGSPKADYYIGLYYKKINNQSKSVKYFKISADAGDSDGQNGYGDCLRLGIGIEKDLDKAIHYYRLSANQGNVIGEFNYGREIYNNSFNDEDKSFAINYLKKAAEKQYPDAMYFYSKTIKNINPEESEKYMKLAIEKGSEMAVKVFGKELINDGKIKEAAELYKSAAQKGMKIGFRKYAKFIDKGCALEEDLDDEILVGYLKKAAQLGDPKDQFNYAEFLLLQDELVDERAHYFKRAAKQGFIKAFFRYAECLEEGRGVNKNLEKAKKYYTLSYTNDTKSPARIIFDRLKKDDLIEC